MNSPTDKAEIELLKEKVEKVVEEGDESVLDFLGVVLACKGKILPAPYDHPFIHYRKRRGQDKYDSAKWTLTARWALLVDDPEGLRVNHREFEVAAEELGGLLFDERRAHYRALLRHAMSSAEGRYFLEELARVGPDVWDDTLSHLSRVLGEAYGRIYDFLTRNGLLVWFTSARKHDSYRLLPQSIPIIKRLLQE